MESAPYEGFEVARIRSGRSWAGPVGTFTLQGGKAGETPDALGR